MTVKAIYTIRDVARPYFWDIVYEWEDIFSQVFEAPLMPVGKAYDEIYRPSLARKVLNRINYYQIKDSYGVKPSGQYLAFHIGPPGVYSFHSRINVVPVIIDFWGSESIPRFERIFARNPLVAVTSKEVYNFLKEKKVGVNLLHAPLSLPDKYFQQNLDSPRDIDVVQLGRQNSRLSQFMQRLLTERKEIHYVWADNRNEKSSIMSSRDGNLGEIRSRDSFMSLLRRSKVSLLSAPGMDLDSARTGGFSPVTPRFLESAACGCRLIGIYPDNDDFLQNGISEICERFDSYDDFRDLVLKHLDSNLPALNLPFLQKHLTSKRAAELKEQLISL